MLKLLFILIVTTMVASISINRNDRSLSLCKQVDYPFIENELPVTINIESGFDIHSFRVFLFMPKLYLVTKYVHNVSVFDLSVMDLVIDWSLVKHPYMIFIQWNDASVNKFAVKIKGCAGDISTFIMNATAVVYGRYTNDEQYIIQVDDTIQLAGMWQALKTQLFYNDGIDVLGTTKYGLLIRPF